MIECKDLQYYAIQYAADMTINDIIFEILLYIMYWRIFHISIQNFLRIPLLQNVILFLMVFVGISLNHRHKNWEKRKVLYKQILMSHLLPKTVVLKDF